MWPSKRRSARGSRVSTFVSMFTAIRWYTTNTPIASPELVQDGVTGLLYRPGDVEDLTEKMIQLFRAPQRLMQMREQAFARGRRNFTVDRFASETLAAYETLDPTVRTSG
jgi:glycosyltransferase involved in cell wall biosynthesis